MQFNIDEKVKALNRIRGSQRLEFSPKPASKDVKYLYKNEKEFNEEDADIENENDSPHHGAQNTAVAKIAKTNKSPDPDISPVPPHGHAPHHHIV